MSELEAVLFDMDGTLVDTEPLWHECEVVTMAQFGYRWTESDRVATVGGPIDRVLAYMQPLAGAPLEDIRSLLVSVIERLVSERPITIQPGVERLHGAVREAGLGVGLASNSWRTLMDIVLDRTGIEFDATVAGDENSANKPSPEPYLHLCRMLEVNPLRSVVIEDSETGIRSGLSAGSAVVAVPEVSECLSAAPGQLPVRSLAEVSVADLRRLLAAHQAAETGS